ncbi:MAG: hypothetical protein JOZ99_09435 [Actinobacteria bacterium]|nr:hypothetical protein [Actinomycetota bacterium]
MTDVGDAGDAGDAGRAGDPRGPREPTGPDEPDPLEAASMTWPVHLIVQYRDGASAQAIADFLDVLRLEDLPGEARVTTDLEAGRSSVAFAPWTRRAERASWERRLSADHLVDDVRSIGLG